MKLRAIILWAGVLGICLGGCKTASETRECSAASDCEGEAPECRTAVACEAGSCVFESVAAGTPLAKQTAGDCALRVCDGKGGMSTAADENDKPDDENPCTDDSCDGTSPLHEPGPGDQRPCYTGPPETVSKGICKVGIQHCDAKGQPVGGCTGEVLPGVETCDVEKLDEDCDGMVNEEGADCVCVPGATSEFYTGPPGTAGVGACHGGLMSCAPDGLGHDVSMEEQIPDVEACGAAMVDQDCDGLPSEKDPDCGKCGDGVVQPGETCDDGNTKDGDECPGSCLIPVVQVVAGVMHTCALRLDGVVKCWGGNIIGQLGLGDISDRGDEPDEINGGLLPAVDLGTGETAVAIAAGIAHTCALLQSGKVKCWGNTAGLGDSEVHGDAPGEMGDNLPSVDLGTGTKVVAIAAGGGHTCALLDSGSLKCWGGNFFGELGLGDTTLRGDAPGEMGDNLPTVDLGTGKKAIGVVAGDYHTCALLEGGSVKCWGRNDVVLDLDKGGQLGLGDTDDRGDQPNEMGDNLPAVELGTGRTAVAIAAGAYHTCALLDDGSVKCWGSNITCQLGVGDNNDWGAEPNQMGDNLPTVDLGAGKHAVAISAGGTHTCVLLDGGGTKCWGTNYAGQLGLNDSKNRGCQPNGMGDNLPMIDLGTGLTAAAIAAGGDSSGWGYGYTCALLQDGRVKCWGANNRGQLGLGDTENRGDFSFQDEMGDHLPAVTP